ncbi:mandelate racemase/muconate lactonizing enzyme family protein [Microvirga puerhi]|uniref:Mandelate racemase/muconate lactonizing enzyme family protein n=1 Tax=Microvirga puerhi TaxID=2876078 RepID=A0ABS7VRQ3_9HYPH|nr:mandelate racemase/muconate lactonizing enzyme family protein [Microvirga puerhi]MBZ6078243.1 mandelate racemase/muconate lactonizing enzyme family protein [Microvirga puerhi]
MKIVRLTGIPLLASFADIFGGKDKIPPHISSPASHFRRIKRTGQVTTLVVAQGDDGSIGYGEAFGLPHPYAASAIVNEVIAPFLVGATLDDPAEMMSDLQRYFSALGSTRGPAMEAISGADIALWDLKARAKDMPLATLLGSSPGPVATYVSPVGMHATVKESAHAAQAFVEQGFVAIKLKIGRGREIDIAHLAAVRDAIGPEMPLFVDANCAYDVETAISIASALAPYDVGWFEEPIPPENPQALAEVRRQSPVPIAAGENEFTIDAYRSLVAANAVDFLQPNITRAGGVSGLLAVGELCAAEGIQMAPHGVGGCAAVGATLHACRAAKAFYSYEANRLLNPLRDIMGIHPARLEDGSLIAQALPGHGGEPNLTLVAKYRIDGGENLQSEVA